MNGPEERVECILLPKDRVGVAIGKNGKVKEEIERRGKVKLSFDSEGGEVWITSGEDPLSTLKVKNVLRAIGRGFSPEKAFRLFEDDQYLEVINLADYVNSEKAMVRLKGRVIGERGRTRETIETVSGVHVSVYGKTVALIGELEKLQVAKRAIEMLLEGAKHSTVYRFLERARKEMREVQARAKFIRGATNELR